MTAYMIGATLAVGVAAFARFSGLDRDRAFYSTVLIVVGSYYVLFAAMAGSMQTLIFESIGLMAFVTAAVSGFRGAQSIIAIGLVAHGIFDVVHGYIIANPGMPEWWPAFCGTYDIVAGVWLAYFRGSMTAILPSSCVSYPRVSRSRSA